MPENGLDFLLERGIDVNLNCGGEFPYAIIAMAYNGNTEGVQMLIEKGADVNKYGGLWHSAIQAAMSDNAISKSTGRTLLLLRANEPKGDFSTAEALLNAGADINACGGQWGTALAAAYRCGYYLIIWKLYDHGASHELHGGRWGTALGSALSGACHTLVQQFVVRHKVDVNQVCGRWGPAIHFLIEKRAYDEEELVQLFLNSGADVNALGGRYGTPLGAAIVDGEPGLVEDLLKRGADPNLEYEKAKVNPLWLACRNSQVDYTKLLIQHGANIHACVPFRGTALQAAARDGSELCIRMLLDAGADINAQTPSLHGTAISAAVFSNYKNTVQFLISKGADVTRTAGRYHSALQVAALKADIALLRFLIKQGAKVNEAGGRHWTPLHAACSAGRAKVAKILLMNGADPNIVGGKYGTALQAACTNGKLKLVRLLLSYGADPKIRGGQFGSALTAAALRGDVPIVNVLLAEEGVVVDMLGEKKHHFKPKSWAETSAVIEAALADKTPLDPFDVDSIKLPAEEPDVVEEALLSDGRMATLDISDEKVLQSLMASGSDSGSDTVFVQRTDSMVAATTDALTRVMSVEERKNASLVAVVEAEEGTMEDMSELNWLQVTGDELFG